MQPVCGARLNVMNALALISGAALLNSIVYLVIIGLIFWVLYYALNAINPPEPFKKVISVVLILVACVFLINWLMSLIGDPFIRW